MTAIENGIGQTSGLDIDGVITSRYPISKEALEKIIELPSTDPDYPLEGSFEANFRSSNNFELKYAIARALIVDGRYPNMAFLSRSFIPAGTQVEPEIKDLKARLQLHLIREDRVGTFSDEAKEAEEEVRKYVDRNELLNKLRGVLPIHVMGAITNALLFEDVTDEKKQEKLRSFTTRALLRPYLGDILVQRPQGELDFRDLVILVPDKVFKSGDSATAGIVRDYFISQAMKLFIDGEETGFRRLNDSIALEHSPAKKEFLQAVEREFQEIDSVNIPPVFQPFVEGWFADKSPMPLFRQKYFVWEFLKNRRSFLNGDTGATKTACSYLAMETIGAEKVTIFGPAKARNTWPREADKIFLEEDKPDVFTIKAAKDLENPRVENAKYLYIGSELMGNAWNNPELYNRIKTALIDKRQTDGIIFDESDEFRHGGTGCTKMLVDMVQKMQDAYSQRNPFEMPSIALTGTPISSSLEDMDITMALLYPDKFALPREKTDGKFPFSVQSLRDPKIAYFLLHGEKLMIQWSLDDLFGEKAPRMPENPRTPIPMFPYQNVIYEWVANLAQLGSLAKTRLLRSVLMNPELIKNVTKERGLVPEPTFDEDGLANRLNELHQTWAKWLLEKDPQIPDEPFSADWIAKFGERDLLLQCFFDDRLVDGVDSLARRHPEISKDWHSMEAVSGKYLALKRFLEQRIHKNGEGYETNEKIFIVSPYHKRGITRWLDDPNTKDEDLADNAWSLYEYIISHWFPGLPRDMAINIDGTRSFAARDRAAQIWREVGDKNALVVASMDSVDESMDWAIRDTESTKNIERMNVIFLGWPFGFDEFKQMCGRFLRPGQSKPVGVFVYETENSIDQGFFNLVRMKRLLTEMALAGVELSPEDQDFFKSSTSAKNILLAQPDVGQAFLQDVLIRLRGRGEHEIQEELAKSKNGKSFYELFAQYYFDEGRDEFRIVGNNAEMVKNLISKTQPKKVLSIGAGTCLFARKMVESGVGNIEIDNVDINGEALRIAKENFPGIGHTSVEGATHLSSASESYDALDCSFMLPMTKVHDLDGKISNDPTKIERANVLVELNRVLKLGSTAVLSFPESSFDEDTFSTFAQTLITHFGFSVAGPSGVSFATDVRPVKKIGWVLTLQKAGATTLSGLNPRGLLFLTDEPVVSKYREGRKGPQTIIKVEYPIFSSKQFEIRNPVTGEITRANSLQGESTLPSPHEMVESIKEELSQDQWKDWSLARRKIGNRLSRRYDEAEEILAAILWRRSLNNVSMWNSEVIQRMVEAEINRMLRSRN